MDRSAVDALFREFGGSTPGCAIAVVRGDSVMTAAYGMADLERGVPLTSASLFNLGSASKQFTAFAVLLLEADGLLSLDDEARAHIPELHDFGERITLRHLLHHTSGLRDTYPDMLLLAGWRFTDHITQDDCLRLIFRQRELSFAPGTEHLYVNANYVLLAEVVARVSGTSLGEFSRQRIFDPLGMHATLVMDDVYRLLPNRSLGYYEEAGVWHNIPLTDTALGSTNVYSSADDMALWLANLATGEVGGPDVLARLQQPGVLDDGTKHGYAGGLQVGPGAAYRGHPGIEHGGQHGGYCSAMYLFPEDDLGIAVMFNHYLYGAKERLLQVADIYLESAGTSPPREPTESRRFEAGAADLQDLAGTFYDPTRRAVREVPFADGALQYLGLALVPVGPGVFTFAEAPDVTVHFTEQGIRVETADRPYTYLRVEAFDPEAGILSDYSGRYTSEELGVTWGVDIDVDEGGLRVRRPKYPDTRMRPLFRDTFLDDWSPVADYSGEFLIEFERRGGKVVGLRVSGDRARGLWFGRS